MSNVIPIRPEIGRQLSLKAQMVVGHIPEEVYWRRLDRAKGGSVVPFPKPAPAKDAQP